MTIGARKVRVAIVDDHPILCDGLRYVLERDGRFEYVGSAGDAAAARALVTAEVDVVLVDLSLRRSSGLDVIAWIRAERPSVRSLMFTLHDEEAFAERALRAGASGFLNKEANPAAICDAVATVGAGRVYLREGYRDALLLRCVGGAPTPPTPLERLTDREVEVLRLLAQGHKASEIARALHISAKTVETHRGNIKQKLGLTSAAALLRAAITAFPGSAGLVGVSEK